MVVNSGFNGTSEIDIARRGIVTPPRDISILTAFCSMGLLLFRQVRVSKYFASASLLVVFYTGQIKSPRLCSWAILWEILYTRRIDSVFTRSVHCCVSGMKMALVCCRRNRSSRLPGPAE